jgi:hypothetical protein
MACIGRLDKQALIRISLAAEDKNLPIHGSTHFTTFSPSGSQSEAIKARSPIGNPRYVNGKVPNLQFRMLAILYCSSSEVPKTITSLLWKLMRSPDMLSKHKRRNLRLIKPRSSGWTMMIVSSAY